MAEGFAANRARWLTQSDTVNKQIMTRSGHTAWVRMTSLRVVMQNVRISPVNINNDFAGDFKFGASTTITASVEYPAGTFNQLKFSGSATGTIADGALLFSDQLTPSVPIPAGAIFWVRMFWRNTGGIFYNAWQDTATYDEFSRIAVSGLSDQTMSGTITDNSGFSCPPAAILAQSTLPSVGIVGDSIGAGNQGPTEEAAPYIGDVGVVAKAIAATIPHQNLSICGARAWSGSAVRYWITSGTARRALIPYCTTIVNQLGINDLFDADGAGVRTAAQLESDLQALWGVLFNTYGLPSTSNIIASTILPFTTSSDSWLSVGGQTAFSQNSARVTFNNFVRSQGFLPNGRFEIADSGESARNSGKWAVGGGINLLASPNTFSAGSWFQNACSVANSVADPLGGTSAWTFTENSGAGPHYISAAPLGAPAGTYTHSVYASSTTRRLELRAADSGGSNFCYVVFDLSAGRVGAIGTGGSGFSVFNAAIVVAASGYYRCIMSVTANATTVGAFFVLDNGTGEAPLSQSYTGDGASNVKIFGSQFEIGGAASDYSASISAALTDDGLHPNAAGYIRIAAGGAVDITSGAHIISAGSGISGATFSRNSWDAMQSEWEAEEKAKLAASERKIAAIRAEEKRQEALSAKARHDAAEDGKRNYNQAIERLRFNHVVGAAAHIKQTQGNSAALLRAAQIARAKAKS